jgi:hypothetical protein
VVGNTSSHFSPAAPAAPAGASCRAGAKPESEALVPVALTELSLAAPVKSSCCGD